MFSVLLFFPGYVLSGSRSLLHDVVVAGLKACYCVASDFLVLVRGTDNSRAGNNHDDAGPRFSSVVKPIEWNTK